MKRSAARATDRIILLGATLSLAGHTYHVPSADFWQNLSQHVPYALVILLAIVGVFGALTPFETWATRSLVNRSVDLKRQILSTFGKLLDIARGVDPPLARGDLALHIWRRQRTPSHPLSGVLKRVATYRMSATPNNRSFSPPKGVGVVGLCWQYNRETSRDVTPLVRELDTKARFDECRRTMGREAVLGLNWTQFNDVKHRTAVFAAPIRNGRGRFVGCVSVDAERGYDVLNRWELVEELGSLALAIGREEFECT